MICRGGGHFLLFLLFFPLFEGVGGECIAAAGAGVGVPFLSKKWASSMGEDNISSPSEPYSSSPPSSGAGGGPKTEPAEATETDLPPAVCARLPLSGFCG